MGRNCISHDLKNFIREQVQTVSRLEVLLMLHRKRSRSFTATDVAAELGFEKKIAAEQLGSLAAAGLLVQANGYNHSNSNGRSNGNGQANGHDHSNGHEPTYRYGLANGDEEDMVDELATIYSQRRVPVLSLLLTERLDRPRVFAEAFRLIKGTD